MGLDIPVDTRTRVRKATMNSIKRLVAHDLSLDQALAELEHLFELDNSLELIPIEVLEATYVRRSQH
jgi:hypothetical protein